MTGLYIVLSSVLFFALILVASMRPIRATVSIFELQRRRKAGDVSVDRMFEQEEYADDIRAILQIKTAFLLVVFVLLAVLWFGWFVGSIIAIIVVLEYGAVARVALVHKTAQKLYGYMEPYFLKFVRASGGFIRFIRFQADTQPTIAISSKDEFIERVRESNNVLTKDEATRLVSGLEFGDKFVSEAMTPRSVIDTVGRHELLGPLTLDTLYKTGHSRLPVIDGDIDHVVGVLYVQDLLVATSKKTPIAADVMESKVFYIREDQTLQHALGAFLKTHHHLFIVVNEYRETVGVLSLEDVIEALVGIKIIDEYDAHDDLRKVAERNPRQNNRPDERTDV